MGVGHECCGLPLNQCRDEINYYGIVLIAAFKFTVNDSIPIKILESVLIFH